MALKSISSVLNRPSHSGRFGRRFSEPGNEVDDSSDALGIRNSMPVGRAVDKLMAKQALDLVVEPRMQAHENRRSALLKNVGDSSNVTSDELDVPDPVGISLEERFERSADEPSSVIIGLGQPTVCLNGETVHSLSQSRMPEHQAQEFEQAGDGRHDQELKEELKMALILEQRSCKAVGEELQQEREKVSLLEQRIADFENATCKAAEELEDERKKASMFAQSPLGALVAAHNIGAKMCDDIGSSRAIDLELDREQGKTRMLEQHVQELEKMLYESVKQGQDAVANNEILKRELMTLREGVGPAQGGGFAIGRAQLANVDETSLCSPIPTELSVSGNADLLHAACIRERESLIERVRELERSNYALQEKVREQFKRPADTSPRSMEPRLAHATPDAAMQEQAMDLDVEAPAVSNGNGGTGAVDSPEPQASIVRIGSGGAGTADSAEMQALVRQLESQNEALRLKLACVEEASAQEAVKSIADRQALLLQIDGLHKQLGEMRKKAGTSHEEGQQVRKSLEAYSQENELLKRECAKLHDHVASLSQIEKESRQHSEEESHQSQQMRSRCEDLEAKLVAASDAAQLSRRCADEAQRTVQEFETTRGEAERWACGSNEQEAERADTLQREVESLRERAAIALQKESESCRRMAQLEDREAHVKQLEQQAQRLAENTHHEYESLVYDHEHFQSQAVESERKLRLMAEEASDRSRQLQKQVVTAGEGELQARRQVEETLEKNRKLMTKCRQLEEKVAMMVDLEKQVEDWEERNKKLQQDYQALQDQFLRHGDEPTKEEQQPRPLLEDEAAASKNDEERCDHTGDGLSDGVQVTQQLAEPEIEKSPPLVANATITSGGTTGFEQLQVEYESLREQAVKALHAEREARKCMEELVSKNQELQQECEHLRWGLATNLLQSSKNVVADLGSSVRDFWMYMGEGQQCVQDRQACSELESSQNHYWGEHRPGAREGQQLSCMRELQVNVSLQSEYWELRQQVASALDVEGEVRKLVNQLRREVTIAVNAQKVSESLAEERLQKCEHLEQEVMHLRQRAAAAIATKPLLHDACAEEAWHRCDQLERECDSLRKRLAATSNSSIFQPLLEDAVSVEQDAAAAEALRRCEALEHEFAKLAASSKETKGQPIIAPQSLSSLTSAMEALHRCEELEGRVKDLKGKQAAMTPERTKLSGMAQPLLDDAEAAGADDNFELELWSCVEEGLRKNEDLKRNCNREIRVLREELESATRAEAESRRKEEERLEFTEQLQTELQELRADVKRHKEAEHDARGAFAAGLLRYEKLQHNCEALQEQARVQAESTRMSNEEASLLGLEMHTLREKASRASEIECNARRSAQAAAELMRRKEELRECKRMREQVAQAVAAEKVARSGGAAGLKAEAVRRSPGVAGAVLGLQTGLQALMQDHARTRMEPIAAEPLAKLELAAQPSSGPLDLINGSVQEEHNRFASAVNMFPV